MVTNLNLDDIIKNHKRIYYFGLGFVQVVMSDAERIHFYNKDIERMNDEVHNHRYNFKSKILKGNFIQNLWKIKEGSTHILTNESCSKEREISNVISIPVAIEMIREELYVAGNEYFCSFNELHSVEYIGNTITHLTRTPIITDYAQVIYPANKDVTCPFSKKYTNDELFQIIEDTINN